MTTTREEWTVTAYKSVRADDGRMVAHSAFNDDLRRIAAVPDMEEALMEVERQMSGSSAFNPWDTGPSAALVLVRAALRKAGRIP